MATSPNYANTPTVGTALLTTGDTSRTAPTTYGIIFTPGASGAQVERVVIEPVGTTSSTVVRIFRYDGSAFHLYTEVQLQVQTAAGSVAIVPQTLEAVDTPNLFPILVPPGWKLVATVNDTQSPGVQVQAEGGSY